MRRKKILVITAGSWQKPVIDSAKAIGLMVIATDKNPSAPALPFADVAEIVDTLDFEAVLRVAQKHCVDAIITEQTDVAVPTAAYVAEKIGLPGISYETSLAVTDKLLMREKCRLAGIAGPQYRKVKSADEAIAAAEEIGFPIVIKPVDGQASRGVAKVPNAEDLADVFAKSQQHTRRDFLLIEEMMTGIESSAEAFVAGDKIEIFGICDKTKCAPPYSFDTRLIYPADFSSEVFEEVRRLNERVIHAVGISMGITHAEYIVTERGVRLLEIAARGCGAGVATRLIPAMTGADLIRAKILQALGDDPTEALSKRRQTRHGLLQFLMLPPGRVKAITNIDEARNIPGVIDVDYQVRAGDRIGIIESGDLRPGHLLAVGSSRDELLTIIEKVDRTVRVEMEN